MKKQKTFINQGDLIFWLSSLMRAFEVTKVSITKKRLKKKTYYGKVEERFVVTANYK